MTEPRLAAAFRRLQRHLETADVRWALVGGLAVSARAEPRTTRDIDVAVATSGEREVEVLVRRFRDFGYRETDVLLQEDADRLATVRFEMLGEEKGILCDLLFASSGIEAEVVAEAERLEVLPGLFSPVARTGHLLALKTLALRPDQPHLRPQDFADIRELIGVANEEEIRRARSAVELISERGFSRGEDLVAKLERQLARFRG